MDYQDQEMYSECKSPCCAIIPNNNNLQIPNTSIPFLILPLTVAKEKVSFWLRSSSRVTDGA